MSRRLHPSRALCSLSVVVAVAASCAAGCVGDIGDRGKDEPGSETLVCDDGEVHVAVRPLRRLTPVQYVNTVRDLFGDAEFDAEIEWDPLESTCRHASLSIL